MVEALAHAGGQRGRQANRLSPGAYRFGLAVAIFTVALSALTGCSTAQSKVGASRKTPSALPTVTDRVAATPTSPIAPWTPEMPVAFSQAWGNVQVVKLPLDYANNQQFVFQQAASPDGQWLVGEIEPTDILNNQTIIPQLALYNISTREIRLVRPLLHPQSQIGSVSTDGQWLVWSEADDQPSFFDWTMYAYNLQSGIVQKIAQAPMRNGQPVSGPHSGPVVSNGYVLWSQPLASVTPGDVGSLDNVVVQMKNLSTGVATTLAKSAGEVALSWPWAAWAQVTSATDGYVEIQNMETDAHQRLYVQPTSMALDGATLVYNTTFTDVAMIADVSQPLTGKTVYSTVEATGPTYIQFPSASSRLLAWNESSGSPVPLVWDRLLHKLITLPTTSSSQIYEAWTGGQLLVWDDPTLAPSGALYVVNTNNLPSFSSGA